MKIFQFMVKATIRNLENAIFCQIYLTLISGRLHFLTPFFTFKDNLLPISWTFYLAQPLNIFAKFWIILFTQRQFTLIDNFSVLDLAQFHCPLLDHTLISYIFEFEPFKQMEGSSAIGKARAFNLTISQIIMKVCVNSGKFLLSSIYVKFLSVQKVQFLNLIFDCVSIQSVQRSLNVLFERTLFLMFPLKNT